MKKVILFIFFLLPFLAYPNLTPLPFSHISEIYFSGEESWQIEIRLIRSDREKEIKIETHSSSLTISEYEFPEYPEYPYFSYYFDIIIIDSKDHPDFSITLTEDMIKMYLNEVANDSVAIGTHAHSYLKNITVGQSIKRYVHYEHFFISSISTIGQSKSFQGTMAKIYGKLYDNKGKPLAGIPFYIIEGYSRYNNPMLGTDAEGSFVMSIPSCSYSIRYVVFNFPYSFPKYMEIIPANFDLSEGDSIPVDFRLLTSTGVDTPLQQKYTFGNYPNPANDYTHFYFHASLPPSEPYTISVYDINGALSATISTYTNKTKFDCSHLKSGLYLVTLETGGRIVATNKLMIIRND